MSPQHYVCLGTSVPRQKRDVVIVMVRGKNIGPREGSSSRAPFAVFSQNALRIIIQQFHWLLIVYALSSAR